MLRRSLLVLTLCLAGTLHAAEVVTLRNGFTVRCVRHEALQDGMVRLYLESAGGGDSFLDVGATTIAAVEAAPSDRSATNVVGTAKPDMAGLFDGSGAKHNVNIALLAAVVQAESGGNAHAVSRTGARGLMQLMPSTAASLGIVDSFVPAANIDGGSSYLGHLLTRYHEDLALALAAYNAGPGAVDRYHGIPPYRETRLYVARVIREFNRRVLLANKATVATATLP